MQARWFSNWFTYWPSLGISVHIEARCPPKSDLLCEGGCIWRTPVQQVVAMPWWERKAIVAMINVTRTLALNLHRHHTQRAGGERTQGSRKLGRHCSTVSWWSDDQWPASQLLRQGCGRVEDGKLGIRCRGFVRGALLPVVVCGWTHQCDVESRAETTQFLFIFWIGTRNSNLCVYCLLLSRPGHCYKYEAFVPVTSSSKTVREHIACSLYCCTIVLWYFLRELSCYCTVLVYRENGQVIQ